MNAISEQKISHVTDVYVTADLYQARPGEYNHAVLCYSCMSL